MQGAFSGYTHSWLANCNIVLSGCTSICSLNQKDSCCSSASFFGFGILVIDGRACFHRVFNGKIAEANGSVTVCQHFSFHDAFGMKNFEIKKASMFGILLPLETSTVLCWSWPQNVKNIQGLLNPEGFPTCHIQTNAPKSNGRRLSVHGD